MLTSVCPSCGSGKIHPGEGAAYTCTACGSSFDRAAVVDVNADGSVDTAQAIYEAVAQDLFRRLYESAAKPIGAAIMASGVVDVHDTQAFTHLIRAGCIGAHKAILAKAEELGRASAEREGAGGRKN